MASTVATLTALARIRLKEVTASYWSDAELTDLANLGFKDLWKAVVDLHKEHFLTIDVTNVSIAASATSMTGVPSDCFRILTIEPTDITTAGSYRGILFAPKRYTHRNFVRARSMDAQSPGNVFTMYYTLTTQGPPVAAPTILCAPKLTTAIAATGIRLAYIPTLAAVASGGNNPIPGESDDAVVAWIVAHARAKEREDRSPDPNWLAKYGTEKQNLVTVLTPRDEQEEEAAEGVFESYDDEGY